MMSACRGPWNWASPTSPGTRFAVSPLFETIGAVLLLANPGRHAINLPWWRWASAQLAAEPIQLPLLWPLLIHDRSSWPEFLAPAPSSRWPDIDTELERMRRTDHRRVRRSLHRVFGSSSPDAARDLARRPSAGLSQLADELRLVYDRVVAPHWARMRAVLDADVAYRARVLTEGGAERLFAGLHAKLHWADGVLTVDQFTGTPHDSDRRVALGPGGLVLLPTILGWPYVSVKMSTSTQTALRYPARGVGALWSAPLQSAPRQLTRLLGASRARLLSALRSPATTTDLARTLGVTPSAVSQHLSVLRDSGLVARERVGREVLYLATDQGLALLGA
jgi:DNA-binding transcriptional ArsR family regulator